MGNRELKLKLWQHNNGKCHWCGKNTTLLKVSQFKGPQPHDLATVDHLKSRLSLDRFIKAKDGEIRKVLACYECNSRRAREETILLSREELVKRGKGFSLNPKGKPIFTEGLESLDEVIKIMKEKLPDFEWYKKQSSYISPKN